MMVVTDINQFSKIVQLVPIQLSNEDSIAETFLCTVVSQHGLSECIMSNHGPQLHGQFWNELMLLLDITLI